jgi:hypothetical protein
MIRLVQRSVGWKASMMKGLEGVCLLMVEEEEVERFER